MMPNMFYYKYPRFYNEKIKQTEDRLITVTGMGKVEVEPDTAILKLGAITKDTNILKAQDENKRIMNQVIDGLLRDRIRQTDIKTIQYTVVPQYDYVEGKQEFRGYEVRNVIEVTVRNTEKIGTIIENTVKNGANYQQGLTYTVFEPEKYYEDALELAVINAQEKAQNIARTLQSRINLQPIKVIEKTSRESMTRYDKFMVRDGGVPVEMGKMNIIAVVEAAFEY